MKALGYLLIVVSIPACLITFGLQEIYGSNGYSATTALPCIFTIGLFLGGLALIKSSDNLRKQEQLNEARKAQEKQAEIRKEEEEIIEKWIKKE